MRISDWSSDVLFRSVLTGVNGSRKSHLLEAINLRNVVIAGLENAHIVLFNYENFRLENEPSFTGHQLSAERAAAWQYHEERKSDVEGKSVSVVVDIGGRGSI